MTPEQRTGRLSVWLNPLELFLPGDDQEPTAEKLMQAMCAPGVASDVESIKARYKAISEIQPKLFALPKEDRILSQLVWPLRYAKASYVVGNYLGTIALSGLVAEMTAMLLFDLLEPRIAGKPMGDHEQELLFGRTFQELGQERRVH